LCSGDSMLPKSLHYAARRTQIVRRKKPGRSGREDNKRNGASKTLPLNGLLGAEGA
jgi:hypothetical protein